MMCTIFINQQKGNKLSIRESKGENDSNLRQAMLPAATRKNLTIGDINDLTDNANLISDRR